jgi:uncharacterized membrane protein YkoI
MAIVVVGAVYVDVTQDYGNAQVILALVNQQRAKKHLKKLNLDQSLTNAAVQRAAEISMVIPTSSPHRRPDGRLAKTVNKKAARENCAEGNFQGPAHVVDVWMHSKPHKATIMLKGAKSAGIAYVSNPADRSVGYYVLIVSKKKAKKIARKDAGLSKAEIDFTNIHLDYDDGRTEYEIDFHKGITEYEYTIDAYTGDILEKSVDSDVD